MKVISLPSHLHQGRLSYLLVDEKTKQAAVIDPYDAEAVLSEAQKENVSIASLFLTSLQSVHHEPIKILQNKLQGIELYSGEQLPHDRSFPFFIKRLKNLDEIPLGNLTIRALLTPSLPTGSGLHSLPHHPLHHHPGYHSVHSIHSALHNPDDSHRHHHQQQHDFSSKVRHQDFGEGSGERAVSFLVVDGKNPSQVIFTGDTLLLGGSGDYFEGKPSQLSNSMKDVFKALHPSTLIYPGSDQAIENLKFCLSVDPLNQKAHEKLSWAMQMKEQGLPAVPSTIQEELSYNPFMRVQEDAIIKATRKADPFESIQVLKNMKNHFRT